MNAREQLNEYLQAHPHLGRMSYNDRSTTSKFIMIIHVGGLFNRGESKANKAAAQERAAELMLEQLGELYPKDAPHSSSSSSSSIDSVQSSGMHARTFMRPRGKRSRRKEKQGDEAMELRLLRSILELDTLITEVKSRITDDKSHIAQEVQHLTEKLENVSKRFK